MKENWKPSFENYEALGIEPPEEPYFRVDGFYKEKLEWLRSCVDKDGQSMFDFNTFFWIMTRGVKGEADEAMQAETEEEKQKETSDVVVFVMEAFAQLGLEAEQIESLMKETMRKNKLKYDPALFKDKTIQEAIEFCRATWKDRQGS